MTPGHLNSAKPLANRSIQPDNVVRCHSHWVDNSAKHSEVKTEMSKPIMKIVIVGGGTAGWTAAAAICSAFPPGSAEVELVESEAIGIIGVGEATLPHLRQFNDNIGIDEAEFMTATNATFKLGIEFIDWARKGDAYIHPFGAYGVPNRGIPFHQFWRKLAHEPEIGPLSDYSLPIVASYKGRFDKPSDDIKSVKSTFGYAYQFDSTLYAPFLRRHAEKRGASRTEGKVVAVNRDTENGDVVSVQLESGQTIKGDFFIDCSGFRSLLIGDALETDYESWNHWLPSDRAVAVQCEAEGPLLPYTRATAESSGWRWRIPLQHRVGNGHVYSSSFMSEDEATSVLLDSLEGKRLTEPKPLHFTTGKRKVMWNRNCVAIGLSGGFLEPLESTAIYLIQAAVTNLIELFPTSSNCDIERDEYNRILDNEFIRVRDFLILHYHATERDDSEFWNHVRTMDIPSSLREKINLFEARGRVAEYSQGLFLEPSWLAVYFGQRVIPFAYDQRVDEFNTEKLRKQLLKLRAEISSAADEMPSHSDFIQSYCHSDDGEQVA